MGGEEAAMFVVQGFNPISGTCNKYGFDKFRSVGMLNVLSPYSGNTTISAFCKMGKVSCGNLLSVF